LSNGVPERDCYDLFNVWLNEYDGGGGGGGGSRGELDRSGFLK
jgi:hypothetical protein